VCVSIMSGAVGWIRAANSLSYRRTALDGSTGFPWARAEQTGEYTILHPHDTVLMLLCRVLVLHSVQTLPRTGAN
jgi:hypothetical protein